MTHDEPPRPERQNSSRPSSRSRNIRSNVDRLVSLSDVAAPHGNGPAAHEGVLANIRAWSAAAVFAAASLVSPRPTVGAEAILIAWVAYSVGLLIALRRGAAWLRRRGVLIHIVDVAVAALVIFLVD